MFMRQKFNDDDERQLYYATQCHCCKDKSNCNIPDSSVSLLEASKSVIITFESCLDFCCVSEGLK